MHCSVQVPTIKKNTKIQILSQEITSLETQNTPLIENLNLIDSLVPDLKSLPGHFGRSLGVKVDGFHNLKKSRLAYFGTTIL